MTLTKPYEATFQVGDGETKDFPFFFDEVSENFIRVIIKRADGSIYYPTFSVDMELLRVVFGEDEITPTPDDVICIYRDTPTIQDTQFNTLQGYNAKALENILSKIVAMIQEMKANGFSTQILQGEPWSLDLIKPADDGASVQIDYQARVLKKGLYFKMSDGNLLASADGVNFVQMPKSENVAEFRQYTDDKGNTHFEYRVGDKWFGLATSADIADTYTKTEVDNKFAVANAQIDANADAIQKTREDYVKKSGDTMTGDLVMSSDKFNTKAKLTTQGATGRTTLKVSSVDNERVSASFEFDYAGNLVVRRSGYNGGNIGTKDVPIKFVYAKYLNSADGDSALGDRERDLIIPSVGGTLARIEDLDAREQEIRDEVNQVDSELQSQITAHAEAITTNKNDIDELGEQVAGIESKIPGDTSETNPLVTKQQLLDEEMDIRDDLNESVSELQTQITAQAAEIATKQDQLTAGDNIIISGNIISATGAGGGVGFDVIVVQELPESGEKGIIYLVPKDSAAPDVYDEYVWVTTTSTFELIGSTKVDLTDYVKNTDYATSSKGGVFKTSSSSYATSVTGAGFLSATSKSLSAYKDAQPTIFISKGTLENIKKDIVERAVSEGGAVLSGYVKDTDYATKEKGGVIRIHTEYGTDISTSGGLLRGVVRTVEQHNTSSILSFISKGTLDNVLTQYAKDDSVGLIIRRL